jgi:hypothetical protein
MDMAPLFIVHDSMISLPVVVRPMDEDEWEEYIDDVTSATPTLDIEDVVDSRGRLLNQQPVWDQMLGAEIARNRYTPLGAKMSKGVVKRCAIGPTGQACGIYHKNPYMNTTVYEVEYDDGDIEEYSANVFDENMLTQVDSEGFLVSMLAGIVDHKKDESVAVSIPHGHVVTKQGNKKKRNTTQGWKLLVWWKDNSETWIPLKDLKASYPVEVQPVSLSRFVVSLGCC